MRLAALDFIGCELTLQVQKGVNRNARFANFEVKVRSGGTTRLADLAKSLTPGDKLALFDGDAGEMSVNGGEFVGMPDDHHLAVAGNAAPRVYHVPRPGGRDRRPVGSGDIDPIVHFPTTFSESGA